MSLFDPLFRWKVIVRGSVTGLRYEEKVFLTRRSAVKYQELTNGTSHLTAELRRTRR